MHSLLLYPHQRQDNRAESYETRTIISADVRRQAKSLRDQKYAVAADLPPPSSLPVITDWALRAPLQEIDRTSDAIPYCIAALSLGTLPAPSTNPPLISRIRQRIRRPFDCSPS